MDERTPDLQYNDRLMDGIYDQDEELHKIILQSRQEYMEQEKKQKQRQLKKQLLQKQLAIPMSRLRLWQKTTMNEEEKTCLHSVLQILFIKTHPDREDEEINIPPEKVEILKHFLTNHLQSSKLYTMVYTTCMEYLS